MSLSKLQEKVLNNKFSVTAEIFPPKGVDTQSLVKKAKLIDDYVDAVNVTDNQRAVMRISSLAVSKILIDQGIEPVYQITCRDRNRLALQSDILGAYALGVRNMLVISGDYPSIGDHPDAKPVYDLDTMQLIKTVKNLEQGKDLAGKKLKGAPKFFLGAAVNPNSTPVEISIMSMQKKISVGAEFFQSQPVFHIEEFHRFRENIKDFNSKVLIGVLLLKSFAFAQRISGIPGIEVPADVLARLESSTNELEEGIKITSALIKQLKNEGADGIHIMAIGVEENIPRLLPS
ncbi:methylenetetrahydrofolate reductase [bacterium]